VSPALRNAVQRLSRNASNGGYGSRLALRLAGTTAIIETVIASASEAIHRVAKKKNGLLRRFRSSQ
jgi:hypothetical protein